MTAIVFFGAIQLIMLGILGEYVGRLCQEAKQRPLFLVDQVVAGGCSIDLPAEFANLGPTARRQIWDSARYVASRTTRPSPSVAPVQRFDTIEPTHDGTLRVVRSPWYSGRLYRKRRRVRLCTALVNPRFWLRGHVRSTTGWPLARSRSYRQRVSS